VSVADTEFITITLDLAYDESPVFGRFRPAPAVDACPGKRLIRLATNYTRRGDHLDGRTS